MGSRLAKPGDPYVTARGDIVVKDEEQRDDLRKADRFIPVIRRMTIHNRRNLNELPSTDLSTQMAINVILGFQLLGLTPNEIAHATKIPLDEVQNLMNGSEYQNTFEDIFRELISVSSNSLRAKIADYANKATDNIIELAETADKEIVKLKANQDILDRAGFGAEQLYGKNAAETADEGDVLKIVIENGDTNKTKIDINLRGAKR